MKYPAGRSPEAEAQGHEAALPFIPLNWSSGEAADGCSWEEREGLPIALHHQRAGLTTRAACDPTRPERICLSTLCCWRRRAPGASPSREPLALAPSELFEAIRAMVEAIAASGRSPALVLIEPGQQLESWQRWLARHAPRLGPHQLELMAGKDWERQRVSPLLDRRPYGRELAARLAACLRQEGSSLSHGHRDYCGHGLRSESGAYYLEQYEDGLPSTLVATWPNEQAFIEAAASWSDYICSGCAPEFAIFDARSEFELNNQRITRERIEKFLG